MNFSKDQNPVTFIDTCGVEETRADAVHDLIVRTARGQVPDGTDLRMFFDESFEPSLLASDCDETRCSALIFVISAYHALPLRALRAVGRAWSTRELEQLGKNVHTNCENMVACLPCCMSVGIRVFCAITFVDRKLREGRLAEMTDRLSEVMRIPKSRVKTVINYTSDDIRSDMTTVPNTRKQQLALEALLCFLQGTSKPSRSAGVSLPRIPPVEAKSSITPTPDRKLHLVCSAGKAWGIWNRQHIARTV